MKEPWWLPYFDSMSLHKDVWRCQVSVYDSTEVLEQAWAMAEGLA